jgi:hypothetical protein
MRRKGALCIERRRLPYGVCSVVQPCDYFGPSYYETYGTVSTSPNKVGMTGSRTRTPFPAADFLTTIAFATAIAFVVRTVP